MFHAPAPLVRHVISIAQAVRHPCCTLHPVVLPVTLVSCPPTPHPLCLPHRHLHPFIHPFSDHPESGRRHQRRRPKNYEGLQPGNARRAVPVRLRQRSLLRRCSCWHAAGSAEQRRSAGGLRGRQRQRPASTGASTGPAGGAAEVEPGRVGGPPAAPAPGQGPGAAVQQVGGAAAAEQRAAAGRSGRRVGQPALLCSGWVGGCSGWAGTGVGGDWGGWATGRWSMVGKGRGLPNTCANAACRLPCAAGPLRNASCGATAAGCSCRSACSGARARRRRAGAGGCRGCCRRPSPCARLGACQHLCGPPAARQAGSVSGAAPGAER